jgi:hypothetical protein
MDSHRTPAAPTHGAVAGAAGGAEEHRVETNNRSGGTNNVRHIVRWAVLGAMVGAVIPVRAALIDGMENATGWSTFADTGSSLLVSTVTGDSGNALQMTYDITLGNWAAAVKSYSSQDFTSLGANALRFHYRATGPGNTAQIAFRDSDGTTSTTSDGLIYKFPLVTDNVWRTLTVPFTDFITFANGDGSFDMGEVSRFSFGLTKDNGAAGTGTVYFDEFELVRASAPVSMIDSVENSVPGCSLTNTCVNDRTGSQGIVFGTGSGATGSLDVSTASLKGTLSREFNCTPAGGFCFLSEQLGGMALAGNETLRFYVNGMAGNEPLEVEVKDVDGGAYYSVAIASVPSTIAGFATVTLSVADIATAVPTLNLGAIKEINFVLDTGAGPYTLFIDDLAVIGATTTAADRAVVDDFVQDLPNTNYVTATSSPTEAAMDLTIDTDATSPGAGAENRVAALAYTFSVTPSTPFAVAEKTLGINLLAEPQVRFRFKGTGSNQNLEVKLKDGDNTVYMKKLTGVTNTGGTWKTATVPVEQFSFLSVGSDALLDLKNISQMEFVVSKGDDGAGTLVLDTLESTTQTSFQKSGVGRVLASVVSPNNPFSPNGDGLKDQFQLTYVLNESADVKLKFYSLHGVLLKTIDAGNVSAGTHTFDWNGVGEDGRRVANGLCFYVLEADGDINGKDTFKEVVGVLR